MKKDISKANFIISYTTSWFATNYSAGRIVTELWCTNQEFYPVDITPPWFFMLMYHLGNEQQARWCPQFRDVVSWYLLIFKYLPIMNASRNP
jgi:hypothetical protein